jgi:peptide deformylase
MTKTVSLGTQVEIKKRGQNMAIRIVRENGDEILRKRSREVEVVDEKIKQILADMVETLHSYNGVGLAGPQIGLLKRLVVIDLYDEKGPIKLVNPKIVKQKGEQEVEEGCLSFPNQFAKIIRPAEVIIEALDENGKKIKIKGEGLLAQAISHELDHLDGVLFVDKIIPGTLEYVTPENEKQK